MSDALFELDDFEETRAPSVPAWTFECGVHTAPQVDDHIADCLDGVCPKCGEELDGWFDVKINHSGASGPNSTMCTAQSLTLNHAIYHARGLNGEPGYWTTNCFVPEHEHKNCGYFRKGAPRECVVAMYERDRAWLLAHNVPAEMIPEVVA